MIASSPRFLRWVKFAILPTLCAAMILFVGCEDEQPIQSYRVPRPQMRLLGVMIPSDRVTWFVKMMGPADTVAASKDDFDQLIKSLRLKDDMLDWTKPDDWKDARSTSRLTYATMRTSSGLAVTISFFDAAGARDRLTNVNRWLRQVGLKPLKADELDKEAPLTEVAGVKTACVVDISGTQGQPAEDETTRAAIESNQPSNQRRPIEFVAPDDWTQRPTKIPEQIVAYRAGEGSNAVDIGITRLGGDGGGLNMNLARWGGQIKLNDLEEVKKHVGPAQIAGEPADRLDATGPEKRRIIALMCLHRDAAWFFTMIGPEAGVEQQRPAFEQMLKSVRFATEE